ncbi:MAG: exosortase H-associated membrane protein [Halioglobus sp.]
MVDQHHLRQFLIYVFVLLIPCFAVWTIASGPLAIPAIGFVNSILTQWFPDTVNALYASGAKAVLMTEFGEKDGNLIPLASAEYRLGFEVNTRIISYSLPFYTTLHFATQKTEYLSSYLWGLLILYPLIVFGLLCLCLRELMVNLGQTFLTQPGVFVPNANVIGILYQFCVLIVPTLAPAILWLWQSRQSPLLRSALAKS